MPKVEVLVAGPPEAYEGRTVYVFCPILGDIIPEVYTKDFYPL